ncbi:MAG: hypothetical protein AAF927_27235 [Bacteroidota bacterium]
MAKKFTTKKLRKRGKSKRRLFALKTNPQTFGLKQSLEQGNLEVIRSLEAKIKEAQAKA